MRPGQQRPGNGSPSRRPTRCAWCFNEAGATTPRKLIFVLLSRPRWKASMRPGQQRPGNVPCPTLAFGDSQASMRPGQQRPGNLHQVADHGGLHPASMRPGQQRPGNKYSVVSDYSAIDASMRPGQQRPGNGDAQGNQHDKSVRFNEAGATTPRKLR